MTYVTTAQETECKLPGRTRAMYEKQKTAKTPMSLGWKISKQGNVTEKRKNSYEFGQEDANARLPGRTRAMYAKTAKTPMSLGWKLSKQGNISENRQNSYGWLICKLLCFMMIAARTIHRTSLGWTPIPRFQTFRRRAPNRSDTTQNM